MADLPNLDAARAALEARRRGKWDDIALADALAAVDALTARLAEAEAENRRLRDALGWTNQECPGKCGAAAFDALAAKVTP